MTTKISADAAEARETLREILKPGMTVWTTLEHVSASGMTRWIRPIVIENGEPHDLTWLVKRAEIFNGRSRAVARHGGIKVEGCGMDMGFHLVYTLSRVLFSGGHACLGEGTEENNRRDRCPSNDHSNDRERDYRPDRMHPDSGYALRQHWL
jgi:hypothetical protein